MLANRKLRGPRGKRGRDGAFPDEYVAAIEAGDNIIITGSPSRPHIAAVGGGGGGVTSIIPGDRIGVSSATGDVTIEALAIDDLVAGSGISVTYPTTDWAPQISNTGILAITAGTGIGVSTTTGTSTISNSGVTSLTAGTNITLSGTTGAVTINAALTSTGVAAQYQFFTYTPLSNFSSDASSSVFAGKTADTSYNLSNRASYNSTTGRLGPTTGNTGHFLAIITFSWLASGIGPITAYLYNNGTGAYLSQAILQPALRYTSTTLEYLDSNGDPASKVLFTTPVTYHWTNATVAGIYNASSTAYSVSLLIDTTAAGGNIDIQNATITYVRIF